MARSDIVRQGNASSAAAMVRALPEARLREVYLLSDKVADAEMRSTLMEAMRAWLRVERPIRKATALRRFCEPFEHLLCGPVGRNRKPFRVPRTAIAPLWALIRQQSGNDSLDRMSLEDLHGHLQAAIAKARKDHRFARANSAGHPDFWEIAGEIDGAFQVRNRLPRCAGCLPPGRKVSRRRRPRRRSAPRSGPWHPRTGAWSICSWSCWCVIRP